MTKTLVAMAFLSVGASAQGFGVNAPPLTGVRRGNGTAVDSVASVKRFHLFRAIIYRNGRI